MQTFYGQLKAMLPRLKVVPILLLNCLAAVDMRERDQLRRLPRSATGNVSSGGGYARISRSPHLRCAAVIVLAQWRSIR